MLILKLSGKYEYFSYSRLVSYFDSRAPDSTSLKNAYSNNFDILNKI